MGQRLETAVERWPLREPFTIARGTKSHAEVVTVIIRDGPVRGRGECVPYARYGETASGVLAQIEALGAAAGYLTREVVNEHLPAGAARNALDCALWDLEAKRTGRRVWELAGLAPPLPTVTAYTLSLGSPGSMGDAARANAARPLLKVKVGASDVIECLRAVRAGAPRAALIVDANEAWTAAQLEALLPMLADLKVALLEQPLPADGDRALAALRHSVPLAADESCHTVADVAELVGRYDVANIKLDKAGGLTAALELKAAAQAAGLEIMVGCMVASSLAIAPAMLLARDARYVDLDGPLLLAEDRPNGLELHGDRLLPPDAALWG